MYEIDNRIRMMSDEELVSMAGNVDEHLSRQAQAELLHRNTKAHIASGKSADHYADKMMGLSLIVGLIALMQLMLEILSSETTPLEKIIYAVSALALLVYAFRDYFSGK